VTARQIEKPREIAVIQYPRRAHPLQARRNGSIADAVDEGDAQVLGPREDIQTVKVGGPAVAVT
jgi:hypothetical protein